MATKNQKMKKIYEQAYGSVIGDATWYRITAGLREHFNYDAGNKNAEIIVRRVAGIKRQCKAFSFRRTDFQERYKYFQHFYGMKGLECYVEQFLEELAQVLKIQIKDVPRSTKHYWFSQAGLNYSSEKLYKMEDLALVAFVAAQWAINRRRKSNTEQIREKFETARKQLCPSL